MEHGWQVNERNREVEMILPRLGRWNSNHASKWLVFTRIYYKGYKWTPFCKVALKKNYNCFSQINTLANFIMAEVPGEPKRNEGAVECAIHIIKEYQHKSENLINVRDIQCTDGNWGANEYMRGMANGLILAVAIMEDEV